MLNIQGILQINMMHNPSPSNFNNMAASPYGVPSPASSVGSSIFDMNITSPESYASSPASNQPRQRLRPWLTDQINEGKTPGLEWVDKVQMIFKIPWKHFGRPGVDEYNDAMLFRNWALHTKKWSEGERTDISTWKTRFRCALTKLQDIAELNNLHQTEGDDPFRVYQFKRKDNEPAPSPNNTMQSNIQQNQQMAGANPVYPGAYRDNTYQFPDGIDPSQLSPDIEIPDFDFDELPAGIISGNNFNPNSNLSNLDITPVNSPGTPSNQQQQMQQASPMQQQIQQQQTVPQLTTLQPSLNQNSVTALKVKLFYKGREVGEKIVDNPRGLRIAFNPPPPLPDDVVRQEASEVVSHIYGPFQAEQIYFPPPTQSQEIMNVLEMTKRGLVLQARNGEILATRLCRAKIFYSGSSATSLEPQELPREHTTPVFDYMNDFLPKFKLYVQGQGPLPSAERYFSFAQRCPNQQSIANLFVYVSVTHLFAERQIGQIQGQGQDILVSDPNMLDCIAAQIEGLSIGNNFQQQQQQQQGL